jgi:hypothetical protein
VRYLPLFACSLLIGCAAGGPGNSGMIAVDTVSRGQPLPGAQCTVSTASGSMTLTTPATAPVGVAAGDLRVICNKSGYRTSEVLYRPTSGSNTSMGIGIGGGSGNVGIGVGFGFPISFGGGGRYPSQITVDMTPL